MTVLPYKELRWSIDEIQEGVCEVLTRVLERPVGTFRLDTHLEDGLGVDSLALVQTQIGIEDHFDVVTPEIDEGTLEQLRTVSDLVNWVAKHA